MQDFKMIQRQLIATILLSVILQANAFSYKDAKNWGKKYEKCNGKHQSPIRLDYPGSEYIPLSDQMLRFTDFNKLATNMTIKNTGHTVEVKANWSGNPPKITGGPLHGNYAFEKATFHWAKKPTGYDYPEHLFDNLKKHVHEVQYPNSAAEIPPIRLANILGELPPPCIFYEGSLDYPPCSESVTWFVLISNVAITNNLVNEFRKIKLAEEDVSNIRPYQPLNHREPQVLSNY